MPDHICPTCGGPIKSTTTDVPAELVCVIDRSGSMLSMLADAQGGLDSFLDNQRAVDKPCNLTIRDFDTQHGVPVPRTPIKDAKRYVIEPRGGTALYDAIAKAIIALDGVPPAAQKILLIVTDGQENSSVEFAAATVKAMIEERQAKDWSFAFVGVGIDAYLDAGAVGIHTRSTVSAQNVNSAYVVADSAITRSRVTESSVTYTDDERHAAGETIPTGADSQS